jgi:hypothetical protein
MAAYANAIEKGSGKSVHERWLFLPVAGGALSVGFNGSSDAAKNPAAVDDSLQGGDLNALGITAK